MIIEQRTYTLHPWKVPAFLESMRQARSRHSKAYWAI